ncbi:MAG: PH domain-containing protein, partial [Mycobacteriales bacterium]
MDGAVIRYGPPGFTAPALAALGVVVGLLSINTDAEGRLLLVIAAVGFLVAAGWLLVGGPPLVADDGGVAVRTLVATHRLGWDEVQALRVDARRRSRALEIETAERVYAVPAMLLGRITPEEVRV